MWRDVFIASMNKGQAPLFAIVFLISLMVLKMPAQDVSYVAFDIIKKLANGSLLGYAIAGVVSAGWAWHSKFQRRNFEREMTRISEQKKLLQSDHLQKKLPSSNRE